jgi:hypothetical protein
MSVSSDAALLLIDVQQGLDDPRWESGIIPMRNSGSPICLRHGALPVGRSFTSSISRSSLTSPVRVTT